MAGTYGSFTSRILRNLRVVSHRGCTNSHSLQQCTRVHVSLATLVICVLFDGSHSDRVR